MLKIELPGLKTTMILVAKCSITLSFNSIYTLTSEFYPTDIRNTLIAICVSFGKLGSCLVPFVYLYVSNLLVLKFIYFNFINENLENFSKAEVYFKSLPYVVFGLSNCLCCVLFSVFMPNNRHKNLNESIEAFLENSKKTSSQN